MQEFIQSLLKVLPFWFFVPFITLGFFLVSAIFQWLWNTTLVDIFYIKKIRFWQSVRLLLMAMILTGGGSSLLSYSVSQTNSLSRGGEQSVSKKELRFGLP